MSRGTMNVARGVITGLVIGGTVGVMMTSVVKPKKMTLKKKTAKALDSVGSFMQSVADFAK